MPSEAQLKAQMQAAIAKKKQVEQTKVPSAPEVKPLQDEAPQPPPLEVTVSDNPPPSPNRRPPVVQDVPTTLTFFGQAIRFTTHRKDVYFAVDDILPLADNADSQNRYIEFKNQPSTRDKAESLVKTLTFTSEGGTEKLDGAKAAHIIEILRELQLSSPGPLARWLDEISTQFKPTDDKSEE